MMEDRLITNGDQAIPARAGTGTETARDKAREGAREPSRDVTQRVATPRDTSVPADDTERARPTPEAPVLLAIDTCTSRSSIALRDAFAVRAESSWESDRHHTAAVSAHIHMLMRSCNIQPAQVGAVAVAIGPGSFTGVRCGLAIAKGMAVARDIPLIGVSAFGVIAAAQPNNQVPVYTVVEAGRGRVAVCRYDWQDGELRADGPWSIQRWPDFVNTISASTGAPAWVCGDLTPTLAAMLDRHGVIAPAPLNLRRAGVLAELAYARWLSGETDDPLTLMPIYPPDR